jgi:catechol 2,3-dioxygenase
MSNHGRMEYRPSPRVAIGHVHLPVADLDRSIAFYTGPLGFDVTQRIGRSTALLGAGGEPHLVGLSTLEAVQAATVPRPTGSCHFALRYVDRATLGQAVLRLREHGVAPDNAVDRGVGEAVYLHDPDGHQIELYWDRPRAGWPRDEDGSPLMTPEPLDIELLARAAAEAASAPAAEYAQMGDATRHRLRTLRATLLHLHKVLLDDARHAYELDRGRVGSTASLLQLVIHDPWFAWLRALSELVVRMDQTVEGDSPATEADAAALVEQVGSLLTASESGDEFPRRYYEALQRQPSVVLAHAEVRRILKDMR